MSYEIQSGIYCENCIKCGKKPIVEQTKKGWEIKCANKACNNVVTGTFINFEAWNRINKTNVSIATDKKLAKSA